MNDTNTQPTFMAWIQATSFRRNLAILIFIFVALAIIAKTVLLFKQASRVGQSDNYPQSVSVTGRGEIYTKPDTLQFNIIINEDGKDVGEATTKASEKASKAIGILKGQGVEEKNIKTTNWSTQDKYENVSQPCTVAPMAPSRAVSPLTYAPCTNTTSKIVGATVYQTLEVKIQDIKKNATVEKRGKIIEDLAAANIKTDGFTFTIFDIDAVKRQAREEAIAKAKADARVLARNLNVNLSEIIGFNEQDGTYNPYMSARAESAGVMKDLNVSPAPQIMAGEQKVVSVVNIIYLLK